MNDNLFLIAIGGTGMRCLESFVHLCAAGLFDNHEINILTLDTDQTNGNKARVESLINLYNNVKTEQGVEPRPRSNTFFSAKLNLYRFFTDYSQSETSSLAALSQTTNHSVSEDNQDWSDLLFERDTVQQFKLDHGYRAQTHLGSMLMYHGIVDAARNKKNGGDNVKDQERELAAFLDALSTNVSKARVFVFGSIFGGTGASSIPVIPRALSEALRILKDNAVLDPVLFGSTLLTDYFTFATPQQSQLELEKVIASSNKFALNCQAALSFYYNDKTVKNTYKRLYHIGWPSELKINFSEGQGDKVKTGGANQKNDCHMVEMMCAAAAYDFFNENREVLEDIKEAKYLFRTVDIDERGALKLSGASFVGDEKGEMFENKLGAFLSFAHIVLSLYDGAKAGVCGTTNLIDYFQKAYEEAYNLYNPLPRVQREDIDKYLKQFAYEFTDLGLSFGWIYQVHNSIAKGNGTFIFAPEAFKQTEAELRSIDPGVIFADPRHHWEAGKGVFGESKDRMKRFDKFIADNVKAEDTLPKDNQGNTLREKFLAHMYNAITKAQHFNIKN